MAMAPPVSAKATLVARKKRPSVVSSSNGLQFTYEKRPGILFRAGRTTSRYVAALNRRSSSGLAPLGDGTKAAVFRARPDVHPRSPSVSKMRMPLPRGMQRRSKSDGDSLDCIGICILQRVKTRGWGVWREFPVLSYLVHPLTYLLSFFTVTHPAHEIPRSCCFTRPPPAPPCPPRSSGALQVSLFGSRGSHRVSLVVATLLVCSSGVRSLRVAANALQGRRRSTLAERTSEMPT